MTEKIISLDKMIQWQLPVRTLDFSQEPEIHETKDGKIFAIKNRRLDIPNGKIICDISGDEDAAKEYLKKWAESLSNNTNAQEE